MSNSQNCQYYMLKNVWNLNAFFSISGLSLVNSAFNDDYIMTNWEACKVVVKYIILVTIFLQAIHKDTEQHTPQLCLVRDLAEALKALLTEESLVDDKVSLLNSNWIAVTSRSEQWLNLLLVRKNLTTLKYSSVKL